MANRWEKILALPPETVLFRQDTGERLKAGWLRPAYMGQNSSIFRTFVLKLNPEVEIPAEMLRVAGDGRFSDSLMKKGG